MIAARLCDRLLTLLLNQPRWFRLGALMVGQQLRCNRLHDHDTVTDVLEGLQLCWFLLGL